MKMFKIISLSLVIILAIVVYTQYPKLNIIAGYAAKNMSSNIFIAKRDFNHIHMVDNNVPSIKIAKTEVNSDTKITTSSVFGLLSRKVFFREGQGSVVIDDDFDTKQHFLKPTRTPNTSTLPYPYGTGKPVHSTFSNIDYNKLNSSINEQFKEKNTEFKNHTRSVLVIYKNHIIAEKYGDNFDKNTRFLGWSMAKSLLSGVIGALEFDKEFDIEKPVADVLNLNEWKKDNRSKITTNHLLKMTSGLEWEEDYTKISDVTKMLFLERDMTKSQSNKDLEFEPGTHFNYSSGTTNLISGVLRSQFKTQQEYLDFPYTHLIDKIGMNSLIFETDMEGNFVGSSYAWATTRDWAKFGLLYLNNGNWNGTQIFSKEWAEYTATPSEASNYSYGAQFRTTTLKGFPNSPKDMYYAYGYHGQFTIIIPSMDIIIVRMGLTHKNKNDIYSDTNKLIKDVISSIN